MKRILLAITTSLTLCLSASADIIAQWDFNSTPSDSTAGTGTLVPAIGTGTFTVFAPLTTIYNLATGSSDPLGSDPNNSSLRLLGNWPAVSTGNKTAGVQMFISTVGWQNVTLRWDQANSGAASKYYRVQYSVDNGTNWVDKDVVANTTGSANFIQSFANISFAAVAGANNNTNFGVRLVSEFESTATGSGTAGYVGCFNTYNSGNANLRLDMVTFSADLAGGTVDILTNPTDVTVAIGQPASFTVAAGGGTTPITYQWRKAGTLIPGATNTVLSFAAAQLTNAGTYDVIVTNSVNSRTSTVATLTVRTPLNLAWTGLSGGAWDTNSVNWVDTGANNVAYSLGDNALFDSRGATAPTITLDGSLNPSSVTVDSTSDYTFNTISGGKLVGTTGLTKRGTGTLFVDVDNTYTGPTVIEAGAIQLGQADAHGSLGSGTITNNAALLVNRTGTFTLPNTIRGNGSITNVGSGAITLTATNTYTGPLSATAGTLVLSGSPTINSSDIVIAASTATGPGGATKFGLGSGGVVVSAGTTIHFTGLNASPDNRATFQSLAGTNIINGPTILEGTGAAAFETAGVGTMLIINGNISAGAGFGGSLFLRGANGNGIVNGTINLPGLNVLKPDTSIWTINSTNNTWYATTLAAGGIRLGAHNALPTGLGLLFNGPNQTNFLDLAGFNQTVASIGDFNVAGGRFITNSSATTDSTLTVGFGNYGGIIADSAAGRKTALTINSGSFTLSSSAAYSGDTTVAAGTLVLADAGEIPNSLNINLAGGGLDVSTKNDQTLTVGATQTLKGNGNLAVTGSLVNNGTIELKVNKTGGIVSNDKVVLTANVTLGGTLRLVLSGQALTSGNTIQIVTASSFLGGSFANIQPAVPAPGLTWDTSTVATDGILRISGSGAPTIGSVTLSASGNSIIFRGTGGVTNGTFTVLTSTNVAAPLSTWTTNQTGSFDGNGNFSVTNAIVPGTASRFFSLQIP